MRKYFKYAIGEIFLVVIGILIALQINNWNTAKNYNEQLLKDLELVLQNLELDKEQVETNLKNGAYFMDYHNHVLEFSDLNKYNPRDIIAALGEPNLDVLKNGYNTLLRNNTLPLITNDSLRVNLSVYYESNLESIEFYKSKLTISTNTLTNHLLQKSLVMPDKNLTEIVREESINEVFLEIHKEYVTRGKNTLHILEYRRDILLKLEDQINEEIKLHD